MAVAAAGWLALFAVYLRGLPGTFYFEDGPELLSCAAVVGNTHPPGYPFLMLAGRLALTLPVGGPGFRFNAAVAAAAAGAAVALGALTAGVVERLDDRPGTAPARARRRPGAALAVGAFAAAVWGLSDTFWWEAVIGDKYAPYYLAWLGACAAAVAVLRAGLESLRAAWAVTGLALGVALAVHPYAIFALPLVAVAAGRTLRARVRLGRCVLMAAVFLVLPLSTRLIYPPLRAQGMAALDWGRPRTAHRLGSYLTGALYHRAFASTSLPRNPSLWTGRAMLAGRFLAEEVPPWMLVPALPGAVALFGAAGPLALGLAGCAAADALYASNFSEKIVRWWEPAYAILLLLAAVGLAWGVRRIRREGIAVACLAGLTVAAAVVQVHRGWDRNALSGFTAAHDFGRNVLRSLPRGAVYLGAGDYDLFPLWALALVEHERTDVTSAGLAAFADPELAVSGRERELTRRFGVGRAALAGLLSSRQGPPLYFAAAGYDRHLQEWLPLLTSLRMAGLVGRPEHHWDPAGSAADTRRVFRAYVFRNLITGGRGALGDVTRIRDEVARGALLQYTGCLITLGRQLGRFGMEPESGWAYARGRRLMEPFTGPLQPPPPAAWLSPAAAQARADQQAIGLGYLRLADAFEARGVTFLATQFRENAQAALQ